MPHSPHLVIAAAVLAAFTANPTAAWGQDAPHQKPVPDSLGRRPDSAGAQTVRAIGVVARRARYLPRESRSALGTATPLLETPQTVTVVSRQLIDDRAMQGLGDVLQYIPGARMGQGEGNRDQPTLRGNSSTASFFVDGFRDDVQYVRDLYNVERVEALLGANALLFGRGGTGGVINRVSKVAGANTHELRVSAGSFGGRRGTVDIGQILADGVAVRGNAIYENTDLFRRGAFVERVGVNPTASFSRGAATTITTAVEYFRDERTADRGVPSVGGRPVAGDPATFFGNAQLSHADARVLAGDVVADHRVSSSVSLRSRLHAADYDKFYQNVYPGAVNTAGTAVRIAAYNNATARTNIFSQTDVTARMGTGTMRHTLLASVTLGRQQTDNFRMTGYFNDATSSVDVPLSDPVTTAPVTFRQSASDADNRAESSTAALHLQDQVAIGERLRVVAGVGVERFAVRVDNNRTGSSASRTDVMVSPRGGVVYKLLPSLALYGSYGVTALPSAGDQFSSLDATSETLEPEQFRNLEVGAKLDLADRLALSVAAYQLNRNKSKAFDPTDPTRTVQTGSQRSRGVELSVQGTVTEGWQVAGGYALQDAVITASTTAAPAGALVPLVPRHSASLWNRIRLGRVASVGVGVVRQGDSFTGLDNTVTLPAYTRFDAAVYADLTAGFDLQVNVENLFDTGYFLTSHNNNNISPGSPRSIRLTLASRF